MTSSVAFVSDPVAALPRGLPIIPDPPFPRSQGGRFLYSLQETVEGFTAA